jgi:hypothetical protein
MSGLAFAAWKDAVAVWVKNLPADHVSVEQLVGIQQILLKPSRTQVTKRRKPSHTGTNVVPFAS